MTTFEVGLRDYLLSLPRLTKEQQNVWAFVTEKPKTAGQKRRHARRLERLEAHARIEAGAKAVGAIDWSKIDWQKIIDFIIKILPLILALL